MKRRPIIRVLVATATATVAVVVVAVVEPYGGVGPQDAVEAVRARGGYAYALVAVLVVAEVGTPIGLITPSELVVPAAGAAAAGSALSLPALLLVVWVAAVTGDGVGYACGRWLGGVTWARRLRHGRFGAAQYAVEARVQRHGTTAVLCGRFVPLARTLVPWTAGACGMPVRTFLCASVTGAALWSGVMCTVGYLLYGTLDRVSTVLAATAGAAVLAVVVVHRSTRRSGPEDSQIGVKAGAT